MKVLGNLPVVKDSNSRYPFGANIKNETETEQGTPVVRELYGDVLMNFYYSLELTGVAPTDDEDSDDTQYQIIEALRKLPNTLNDIEQVLTLTGTVWSVPFNLAYLPDKYFFIARASEDYISTETYTFKGSGVLELPFSSVGGFSASDELLVIIDTSGVRAYSLSKLLETPKEIFTVMGTPLAFNDTENILYQEDGYIISDMPTSESLQSIIRVELSDGTIVVNDILMLNGFVLCFCLVPGSNEYFFRQFPANDLSASSAVTVVGTTFPTASDFSPYIYAESGAIYCTNECNLTANDETVVKLNYTPLNEELTYVSTTELDPTFVKTTSGIVKTGYLYTFESGNLNRFNLSTGVKEAIMFIPGISGQIFQFNSQVYFTSGEVAKRWTI